MAAIGKDGKFNWDWDSSIAESGGDGADEGDNGDANAGGTPDLDALSFAELQALLKDRDDVIASLKGELDEAQKASSGNYIATPVQKSYLRPKRTPKEPTPTTPRMPNTTARYSVPRPARTTPRQRDGDRMASSTGSIPLYKGGKASPRQPTASADRLPAIKPEGEEDEDSYEAGAVATSRSYAGHANDGMDTQRSDNQVGDWRSDPNLVEWWASVQRRNADKRNQQLKKANRDLKWILNRREKQRQRQKLQEKQMKEKAKIETARTKNMSWRGLRTMVALAGPGQPVPEEGMGMGMGMGMTPSGDGAPLQWRPQPPMKPKPRPPKTLSVWCRPGLYTTLEM